MAENVDSGEIIALVGGRTYDVQLGLNRATQIRRQPGSAIKPVSSYAAAVEGYGYLPTSFVDDTPRVFSGGYQPGNAGGNYYGEVTLREALSRSLNVATVDLAETVGIAAVARATGTLWHLPRGARRRPCVGARFDDRGRLPRPALRGLLRAGQRRPPRGGAHGAQNRVQRRQSAL